MAQIINMPSDPKAWRAIFETHLNWANSARRVQGMPAWDHDGLNVIGIRCNPITGFYVKDKEDFNDWLVLVQGQRVEVFACTTDPAHVNVNPAGVAHLCEGVWASYIRGTHKAPWRTALVQSKAPVRIVRTDQRGNILRQETGYFGINIHNAAGWNKPSAGCTVLKPEKVLGMLDKNFQRFAMMVKAAPDRPVRSYCLINAEQLRGYGVEVLL